MPIRARKQKDGKTVFDVRVQYGGMRLSRTVPTTLTAAKRVESKLLQDLIQGRFDILKKKSNPTFRQYAEEYKNSVTWQKSYRRTVTSIKNLVQFFGKKRLSEITTKDFIDYRTKRLGEGRALATINREHACLNRMLNLAIQSDEFSIKKNPLKPVKMFAERPTEERTLSVMEYRQLLDAAPEYFRRIILFACNTAMRKMEILNLQFKQIKIGRVGSAYVELLDTKSGKLETVPLNNEVVGLLEMIGKERGMTSETFCRTKGMSMFFWGNMAKSWIVSVSLCCAHSKWQV